MSAVRMVIGRLADEISSIVNENLSRERVRRAAISLALLKRYMPDAVASPYGVRS